MRYKIGIQYLGTHYSGFAFNDSAQQPSVLAMVEQALKGFCNDQWSYSDIMSSSRTDAGVHALRNVIQVDMHKKNSSVGESLQHRSYYDEKSLKNGLNYYLRPDKSRIYITDVSIVDDYFNVREQALARTYMYRILNQKGHSDSSKLCQTSNWSLFQHELAWTMDQRLDLTTMVQASKYLLGEQDFASFRNMGCQSKSTIRNMQNIQIYVNKKLITNESSLISSNKEYSLNYPSYLNLLEDEVDEICITFTADSFLQRMVRNIVGVLVKVGKGQWTPHSLPALLASKNRHLVKCAPAPPQGLFLVDVHY